MDSVDPAAPARPAPAGPGPGRLGWFRRYRWVAVLVGVFVVMALIVGAPASSPPAYDPASTTSSGTKALVLLLERLGATVHTGGASPVGAGPALQLVDQLNTGDEDALLRWVAGGHTLVVADPTSVAAQAVGVAEVDDPAAGVRLSSGETLTPDCGVAAIAGAQSIRPAGGGVLSGGAGSVGCYPDQDGAAYLVASAYGRGVIVVVGGPGIWTNAQLGQADNSVLAADLLVAGAHPEITILGASRIGGGSRGLLSLISPHVASLVWQLGIAFLIVALWRARRLGRPVLETPPVEIPASELVVARANLLQEGRHRRPAAAALRADFARRAARRLGVPAGAGIDALADAARNRAGVDPQRVRDVLAGPDPTTDLELVHLVNQIDETIEEITHAQAPDASA